MNGQPEGTLQPMILNASGNLCLQTALSRSLSFAHRLSHPAVTGSTSAAHLLCPGLPETSADTSIGLEQHH